MQQLGSYFRPLGRNSERTNNRSISACSVEGAQLQPGSCHFLTSRTLDSLSVWRVALPPRGQVARAETVPLKMGICPCHAGDCRVSIYPCRLGTAQCPKCAESCLPRKKTVQPAPAQDTVQPLDLSSAQAAGTDLRPATFEFAGWQSRLFWPASVSSAGRKGHHWEDQFLIAKFLSTPRHGVSTHCRV